ncbi:MAG TPA: nickel pincer cofactor biosynthesis protein LarC [Bryobacteraceae bacterium]|nr:nickel pincer cofactor biosynthesis protein LarC [Bryobacteraceae bacterium]
MKISYFDAFSGISGDMTVGALVDAGASFDNLRSALSSLAVGASIRLEKTKRRGIAASKFYVDGGEQKAHRHLHHIEKMINEAPLTERVKQMSLAVFQKLAESEAKVHGTTLQKVHFHEVGAVDSICDIVGACVCLDDLGIDEVYCSPINAGSGTVNTEHGILPVPAPATADLLSGKPVYSRGPALELTTPTGAALISALAKNVGTMPAMKFITSGYGAGDRDFPEHANVLRVIIGESANVSESPTVKVLEANIDDSTPEVLGYATECLLAAGALDVTLTPLQMKKNRPGVMLTVIADPGHQEALSELIFRETSTLGIRITTAERRVQPREVSEVQTSYGSVRIKSSAGGAFAPEYEDCRRIAVEHNIPLRQIIAEAELAFLKEKR